MWDMACMYMKREAIGKGPEELCLGCMGYLSSVNPWGACKGMQTWKK